MALNTQKFSASIPIYLVAFIRTYREMHQLRSDSEVIAFALKKLEREHLADCYLQAQKEVEDNPEIAQELALWEQTTGDGIEPEDW